MTFCSTVVVKFADKNIPAQEIRALAITGAAHLFVSRDSNFITISCQGINHNEVQQINFSIKDVKEFACEGVFAPKQSPGTPITLSDVMRGGY